MFKGKVLEVECLARTDADPRQLGADFLFIFLGRSELQGEVEVFKEFSFLPIPC
jgi:hypothetical protein